MKKLTSLITPLVVLATLTACQNEEEMLDVIDNASDLVMDKIEQRIDTTDLMIPPGFDFETDREVTMSFIVDNEVAERAFLSAYPHNVNDKTDFQTQLLRIELTGGAHIETHMMLPNHTEKIMVEVWLPGSNQNIVKKTYDIIDGKVSVVL